MGNRKDSPEVREQRKLLFQAAQTGILDSLRQALEQQRGSSSSTESSQGFWDSRALLQPASSDTVLHVAARSGSLSSIRFFVEALQFGHLLTAANQDGKCALHEAAQSLHCEVAQYLIDRGTPVDVLKRADWTPLMLACTRDDSELMIELMLRNGARATLRNKDGWTPFHIATRKGDLKSLRVLLAHNSLLWKTASNNKRTPLHTAAVHGHSEVVSFLLSLASAAETVNFEDSCGTTALMDAARFNSAACCERLIANGAEVLTKDGVGRNALHVAAQAGSTEVVGYLLHSSEDCGDVEDLVNCRTQNGQTMLHLAAREGHADTLRYLLSVGADMNAKDHDGCTAVDIAGRYKSDDEIVAILKEDSGEDKK